MLWMSSVIWMSWLSWILNIFRELGAPYCISCVFLVSSKVCAPLGKRAMTLTTWMNNIAKVDPSKAVNGLQRWVPTGLIRLMLLGWCNIIRLSGCSKKNHTHTYIDCHIFSKPCVHLSDLMEYCDILLAEGSWYQWPWWTFKRLLQCWYLRIANRQTWQFALESWSDEGGCQERPKKATR